MNEALKNITKSLQKRLDLFKKLNEDFDNYYNYVKPILADQSDAHDIAKDIKVGLVELAMEDLNLQTNILSTILPSDDLNKLMEKMNEGYKG